MLKTMASMGKFPGPHEPWDTPRPWTGLHEKFQLPQAAPQPNWITGQPEISECQKRQLRWSNTPSDQEIAAVRADYADHLALLDEQLGLLLEHLAEPERTSITIVSDKGELLGDGEFF